ncbi:MAG: hypothetical protein KDC48_14630 [Planctomycetes bacterium]|nr:hypothetical protein [Planctomycetota bacterium]
MQHTSVFVPPSQFAAAALLSAALAAQSPTLHQTVPAAYAATDANSLLWVAGTGTDVRQQTLIGASHLTNLLGRELLALEIRRTASADAFAGATADWTVQLSHTNRDPLGADRIMDNNVGANAATVFQGLVTAPNSPATTGSAVPWSTANTIRVVFQTPFVYAGGTLCVDIVGHALPGQTSDWWVGDAVFEDISGTTTTIGNGCGMFGGSNHDWAYVCERTLLPGAFAQFRAHGTTGTFAVAMHGLPAAAPVPLSAFGVPAPGCSVALDPTQLLSSQVAMFAGTNDPFWPASHGTANVFVALPADPWIFGLTLATQWFDLGQPATSNAVQWTVANQMPSLDLAYIDGVPDDPIGLVTVHHAPVYRFDYR